MKLILFVLLIATAGLAFGQAEVRCSSSERFGNILIRVGDSERRVIEQKPDREVRLETTAGGAAGYRFDFYKRGRTVQVYTSAGVVTRICRIRE